MKTIRACAAMLVAMAIISVATNAGAATITTSYGTVSGPDDNNQATVWGQGITVNVGADTPDGSIPATVYLNEVSFQISHGGSNSPATNVYLHVYDDFVSTGGTPTTIGNLVAVSSSTVNLATATSLQQITWSFAGDAVNKATTYYYILANNTTAATTSNFSNLTPVELEVGTGDPYAGGRTWWALGSLPDSGWDVEFLMKTSTVPEPSSLALLGLGSLLLLRTRRKR
jgi:hypothetical protein